MWRKSLFQKCQILSDSNLLLVSVLHHCKLNVFGFCTAVCVPVLVLLLTETVVNYFKEGSHSPLLSGGPTFDGICKCGNDAVKVREAAGWAFWCLVLANVCWSSLCVVYRESVGHGQRSVIKESYKHTLLGRHSEKNPAEKEKKDAFCFSENIFLCIVRPPVKLVFAFKYLSSECVHSTALKKRGGGGEGTQKTERDKWADLCNTAD